MSHVHSTLPPHEYLAPRKRKSSSVSVGKCCLCSAVFVRSTGFLLALPLLTLTHWRPFFVHCSCTSFPRSLHSSLLQILSREPRLYKSSFVLTPASRRTPQEPTSHSSLRRHLSPLLSASSSSFSSIPSNRVERVSLHLTCLDDADRPDNNKPSTVERTVCQRWRALFSELPWQHLVVLARSSTRAVACVGDETVLVSPPSRSPSWCFVATALIGCHCLAPALLSSANTDENQLR